MSLKKHKPNLDGVLKRRRQTVATYLKTLHVTNHDALEALLVLLHGSHRISEQFETDAKAYVDSIEKPVKLPAPKKVMPKAVSEAPAEKAKAPPKLKPKKQPQKRPHKVTKKPQPIFSEKE